jgi:peroxisomal 3,2-trans-enoyl-CoA isomerase
LTDLNNYYFQMYKMITKTLQDSNEDDAVNIVVLTGAGDYFCSGNDLGNFMNVTDPQAMAKDGRDVL